MLLATGKVSGAINKKTGGKMKRNKQLKTKHVLSGVLGGLVAVGMAGSAVAGPGSVEVTTVGDIKIKMGAQVRIVPTDEMDRDFGLSKGLTAAEEARAAAAMGPLGVGADSTRVHLTEAGGAVKDGYIRGENRLFFNFSKGKDWDVYMALESDTVLDRKSADRTDFAFGRDTQQFGIERLMATFNVEAIHSRVQAGWDALGVDIGYGGLVYGDDDPGIGIVGKEAGFNWDVRYLKKDEKEAGFYKDAYGGNTVNPIGYPTDVKDSDRTFYYGLLGYDVMKDVHVEGFYFLDANHLNTKEIDHHFVGLQGKATYGIFKPMFEAVYSFGDYREPGKPNRDIDAWALFADVAVDLKEQVALKEFEAHLGGYYLQGDDDPADKKLKGFASAVSIDRFSPRFGTEQGIANDGNPIFGQILYSMFPMYYGSVRGAGINGAAALDNPGFVMLGGGLKAGYEKWTYITNVMGMWFDAPEAVENYFALQRLANVKVDSFMGVEWNNELRYQIFKEVTLKGGAAVIFPGSGAEDITKALNAIARGVTFDKGKSSNDPSLRLAAELLWFF